MKLACQAYLARGLNSDRGKPLHVSCRLDRYKRPIIATYSIKPLLLALTIAAITLPGTAMAGPAAMNANAPLEMSDIVSDDTPSKAVGVSHIDIQPGQSLDCPASLAPQPRATVQSAWVRTLTTPDA